MRKTIVISGGSKGIGRAIALKFAARDWNVAVCARTKADLDILCKDAGSRNLLAVVCDVRSQSDIKAFGKAVSDKWGNVDVIVNNAGVFTPGRVTEEAEGTLENLMDSNLFSAYHLTRCFVKGMMEQKSGHIFNISSVAGLQAYPNGGSYSITKFAMEGLSKALREELKSFNVRVTNIAPGATLTESWKGVDLPESRFIKAEDIAAIIWDIYNLSENTVVENIVIRPQEGDI